MTRTLNDIQSSKVGVSLAYDEDDLENAELDISSRYLGVINDGVDHYLALEGRWGMSEKVDLVANYLRSLNEAHTFTCESAKPKTRLGL
jgi:hypothetical protein